MEPTNRLTKLLLGAGLAILIGLAITDSNQALAQEVCVAPPSGLIGWWDADSVDGTTATDIESGLDGTILGGVAIVPGKVGNAFSFAGGNEFQHIQLPFDSGDVFTDQFTVDAWAFPTKLYTAANGGAILQNDDQITPGPGTRGMFFGVFGGLTLPGFPFQVTAFFSNTAGTQFNVAADTTPNVFHHYAVTYDGSQLCLYQDGMLEECVAASGNVNDNGRNFQIAGLPNFASPARHYGGLIDEVEIYDRALSAAEILAIFNAGSAGKCKSTLSHFQCYRVETAEDEIEFAPIPVNLVDQFGETLQILEEPAMLCVPVDKNGEGIQNPVSHLTCYELEDTDDADEFEPLDVAVNDQFGELILTVQEPKFVCVPSTKEVLE